MNQWLVIDRGRVSLATPPHKCSLVFNLYKIQPTAFVKFYFIHCSYNTVHGRILCITNSNTTPSARVSISLWHCSSAPNPTYASVPSLCKLTSFLLKTKSWFLLTLYPLICFIACHIREREISLCLSVSICLTSLSIILSRFTHVAEN